MQDILKPLDLDTSTGKARSRRALRTTTSLNQDQESRQNRRHDLNNLPAISPSTLFKPARSLLRRFPWKSYLVYFPILVIGVIGYAITVFIFMTIEPRSIQHTLLTNSYAPLMISSGLAHFAVFSYLLLSTRRGAVVSLILSALLFLRLQQVLTQELAIQVVLLGISVEVTALVLALLLNIAQPKLQGLHGKIPRWKGRKLPGVDLTHPTTKPTDPQEPKTSSRKRGRKRKHHFFGK